MVDSEKQRAAAYRRDLQRLIALSFSAGELSKYAERWRIFTDREGGSEGGARALVRALAGRDKLGALVESLRAHKPLVEWPDPPPRPTVLQEPLIEAAPPLLADPQDPGEDADDDEPPSSSRVLRGEPLIDPYSEYEGTTRPPDRVIRRWLPAIAVGLAGIAVGATAMYLAHPERKTTASAPAAIADLAADHMRDRVDAIAEACQVPTDGDAARDVLAAAFGECDVPEIRPRRRLTGNAPTFDPGPAPPPAPPPRQPPSQRRQALGNSSPSGAPCKDDCQDTYTTCAKENCGAEPASAAENAAWSRCLNACQSTRMRCRLACR